LIFVSFTLLIISDRHYKTNLAYKLSNIDFSWK